MHLDAGVRIEPCVHGGVLMGGVVVGDDVQLKRFVRLLKASTTLDIYAHINQQVHRDRAARMEQLLLGERTMTPEFGSPTGSLHAPGDVGAA